MSRPLFSAILRAKNFQIRVLVPSFQFARFRFSSIIFQKSDWIFKISICFLQQYIFCCILTHYFDTCDKSIISFIFVMFFVETPYFLRFCRFRTSLNLQPACALTERMVELYEIFFYCSFIFRGATHC